MNVFTDYHRLIGWLRSSFGWRYCVLSPSTGINFKEVNPESTKTIFGEIHTSIDTLAFTFGNVWVLFFAWLLQTQVSTAVFGCSEEKLIWFWMFNPSICALELCWNIHSFSSLQFYRVESDILTFVSRVSDFLMGDVDSGSGLGTPQARRSRVSQFISALRRQTQQFSKEQS